MRALNRFALSSAVVFVGVGVGAAMVGLRPIVELMTFTDVPAAAPNVTVVSPDTKLVPLTVTVVPPPSGPRVGDTEATVGAS